MHNVVHLVIYNIINTEASVCKQHVAVVGLGTWKIALVRHPTRTRTRVYRGPNMHSDRNAKEPGSMAWQSEHILICSDDHIVTLPSPSGSAPLRFTHTGIPRAYTNCTFPIQSAPHTSASPIYGVPHTGVNLPGCPSHSFTGMPPMTSQQAIPLQTPFVAKGECSHPTRT